MEKREGTEMFKCLIVMVGIIAFAPAAFALGDAVCIVPLDKTVTGSTSVTYVPAPSKGREVIYDDQTWDEYYCTNGLSIYGEEGYESVDDFVPEDDITVNEVVIWITAQGVDLRCDIYEGSSSGPGDDPPADFFNEEVPSGDITWEDLGGWWPPVVKATVPITDVNLTAGETYWLGFQNTTGGNTFWWAFDYGEMGGPYWEQTYFWYVDYWTVGEDLFGSPYEHFYELHGTLTDNEDPEITETYPHDSDFPSGVPVGTNVTFHVTDNLYGCDTGETTCTVEENGDPVLGELTFDDSDPLDVAFAWEADDDYTEGASIDVAIVTYDLAGNGPVTEEWTFTTGYVNITPKSLGVIKAGFIK
jgi:hypothetical protein